ncbi:MAG TPA: hypothetical protein VFB12_28795 [Ktedonobacteraceae bacterium]|nr:hypothetical protein [Ktedonobacteraceae bacterium]
MNPSTFTRMASVEIRRRQVREAKEVCAVMDGADWCQLFAERHRPDAVRILDFPHAAEHINPVLEVLERANMPFPPQMLDRCLHILKHRGPQPLLRMATRLGNDLSQQKEINTHLDYLRKREAQMQYPAFRQKGWPIGSGMVESAQKNVVEARLKGAGMHWQRKNVNPMLALRNAECLDRGPEMWHQALTHQRKQKALHRSARVKPRTAALPPGADVSSQGSTSAPSAAMSEYLASPPPPVQKSSQLSSRRHTQKRATCFQHHPSDGNADGCLCGTPLVRVIGHRPREYCSDRCRQRARRERQAQGQDSLET